MKLNNRHDCEQFLAKFKNGYSFIFRDSKLSMPTGGATTITKKNDEFFIHASGQNWSDQQSEFLEEPMKFIWKNRKDIVGGMWL